MDDLGLILMDFGCMLGWCWDGFLTVLEGFRMNVGWICGGRCLEFCFFLCFLDCLNFMTFLKLMAIHGEVYGSVLAEFGRAMAKL